MCNIHEGTLQSRLTVSLNKKVCYANRTQCADAGTPLQITLAYSYTTYMMQDGDH